METNLIGYYQIDCEILIAVSDCKQIKMIPMIKSVLDENDLVLISYSTNYNILIFLLSLFRGIQSFINTKLVFFNTTIIKECL